MAVGTSSQLPSDSWDQPHIPSTPRYKMATQVRVPDDWDDEEEGEDGEDGEPVAEESNKRIWEDANAKAPNPMPELIVAPSTTSSNHVVPPPLGAFQPTMRILKRPESGTNNKPATPPPSAESLKEREARYQAARERIFGSDSEAVTPYSKEATGNSSSRPMDFKDRREWTQGPTSSATVIRNPRGPSMEGTNSEETPPRGFNGQRTKLSLSGRSTQTTTES
ncbi:hypothetical protein C0989_000968 [Termitomyces sp. Mn162]|nr:hypothetical protein C0989_000968 [Termitomyces sp. Mn162]